MRVDRARLERSMQDLGRIGVTERGGLTRLALTDEDKRAKGLSSTVVEIVQSKGFSVIGSSGCIKRAASMIRILVIRL